MYHYYCTEVCLAHQILEQFGGELSLVGSGRMAKFGGSGKPLAAVGCQTLASRFFFAVFSLLSLLRHTLVHFREYLQIIYKLAIPGPS